MEFYSTAYSDKYRRENPLFARYSTGQFVLKIETCRLESVEGGTVEESLTNAARKLLPTSSVTSEEDGGCPTITFQ
jgi:hypothetical protein